MGEEKEEEFDIDSLLEKNKELEDKYIRLYAEFENHKKRFRTQLDNVRRRTKKSVVVELFNIIDDINMYSKNPDTDGASVIFKKIKDYIVSVGVEQINCEIGDEFNSDIHDCVSVVNLENVSDNNKIVEVIQRGYKIDGVIVKFPKVIISK